MSDAFIFGQDTERVVASTGWIGEDPTGKDIPFFLLHPHADDVRAKMRKLAAALGIEEPAGGEITTIPADLTYVTFEGEEVKLFTAGSLFHQRPVNADWVELARERGQIVLVVGERGFTPRRGNLFATLDKYLFGPGMHLGLVRVTE